MLNYKRNVKIIKRSYANPKVGNRKISKAIISKDANLILRRIIYWAISELFSNW